jgi:hypothetical protein
VTVFTKNRDQLLEGVVVHEFLRGDRGGSADAPLLPHEHFSVDGTLVEAWAGLTEGLSKVRNGQRRDPIPSAVVQEDWEPQYI